MGWYEIISMQSSEEDRNGKKLCMGLRPFKTKR